MTDRKTRRLSLGSIAADYDRYRPAPPPQALDWLILPGAAAILDMVAGAGLVTRELIGHARWVVAVELDERMRAVLADRCQQTEVLAGPRAARKATPPNDVGSPRSCTRRARCCRRPRSGWWSSRCR